MKRKILLASMAATMGMAGVMGVGLANAQSNQSHQTALVDKLATKFNLNKDEVQQVFDEQHKADEQHHEEMLKERLDQAVKDGKLTQDQEDKLLTKYKEEQTFRDSLKDKSETERHDAMKKHFEELQKWASDNNIPKRYLLPGHGGHGHKGRGGGF